MRVSRRCRAESMEVSIALRNGRIRSAALLFMGDPPQSAELVYRSLWTVSSWPQPLSDSVSGQLPVQVELPFWANVDEPHSSSATERNELTEHHRRVGAAADQSQGRRSLASEGHSSDVHTVVIC